MLDAAAVLLRALIRAAGTDAEKQRKKRGSDRGYKRGYKTFFELGKANIHTGCGTSLDRFHTTNKTSKGVRFYPPDALFHWELGESDPGAYTEIR